MTGLPKWVTETVEGQQGHPEGWTVWAVVKGWKGNPEGHPGGWTVEWRQGHRRTVWTVEWWQGHPEGRMVEGWKEGQIVGGQQVPGTVGGQGGHSEGLTTEGQQRSAAGACPADIQLFDCERQSVLLFLNAFQSPDQGKRQGSSLATHESCHGQIHDHPVPTMCTVKNELL